VQQRRGRVQPAVEVLHLQMEGVAGVSRDPYWIPLLTDYEQHADP
jgi:hypothetical protein